jgi:hypothetical protein
MSYITATTATLFSPVYENKCAATTLEHLALPPHLANYAVIGHVYTVDGSTLCKYCDEMTVSQSFCEKAIEDLRNFLDTAGELSRMDSKPLAPIYGHGYPIIVPAQKGYQPQSNCLSFRVRSDSRAKQNNVEAVAFANREMERAFSSEESLESFLVDLNRLLTNGLEKKATNKKGYRTEGMTILRDNPDPFSKTGDDYFTKTLQKVRKILGSVEYNQLVREEGFSAKELQNINKKLKGLIYIPTHANDVSNEMKTFIKELFAQLKQPAKSAHETAAWAHIRYVQIHPHYDCNGKGARMLFNMILAHHGEGVLVFPDDNEYTLAVENELAQPGSFLKYVTEKVVPWNEKNQRYFVES